MRRSLGSAEGKGNIHLEADVDATAHDVWSALTDPVRLAQWYGDVQGDLRPGGEFRARLHASGWEGSGRVDACEPPRRLLVTSREADSPEDEVVEAVLIPDGDGCVLVLHQTGLPLEHLAAYGAGLQVHVEDLLAHLAGRERAATSRWAELLPAYQAMSADAGQLP